MSECTCKVEPPIHHHARGRSFNKYAIYLDFIEDNTVTDPKCPYHGDNGSMVTTIKASRNA